MLKRKKNIMDTFNQEQLTTERLELLSKGGDSKSVYADPTIRHESSLIYLVHWARARIANLRSIKNQELETFIHNKISIDGSFIAFCEEKHAKITAILTDAITSWKTEAGNELFLATGIFEIEVEGFRLFQCSLFHKGSHNDDEVAFFVILEKKYYQQYLKFRNEFVDWQVARERNSSQIEVIGGEPIALSGNFSWEDLFLEESLKEQIISTIDGFLKSKAVFEKFNIPWKRGVVFWGPPGVGKTLCLKTIIHNYPQFKPVTIQPGYANPDEILDEVFNYAAKHAPSLLYFEDFQELIQSIDQSHFLQLLDGVQARDGIFIVATGNDLSALQENITSRPRRFDKFYQFKTPTIELTKKYLAKYFGDILSQKKVNSLAKSCVSEKLTYAQLQEVYFNSVFISINSGRDVVSNDDVDQALSEVLNEKEIAAKGFIYGAEVSDEENDSL